MSENKVEVIDINDDDEGFVSCQVCFTNFNEVEHLPKFLDKCHHFFCLTCIESLVKGTICRKKVTCPVCRAISVLGKKKCEDLGTNHVALRLLKVVEESQKKQNEGANQQWCSECNASASRNCQLQEHQLGNFKDVHMSHSLLLKDIIINSNSACDQTLEIYRKIQSTHEDALARIKWLESEMNQKVLSNNTSIAHLESLKSVEGCIDALMKEDNEDMSVSINKINQLVIKFSDITEEAKAAKLKAKDYLETQGRNDVSFLITLLKGQNETEPSENFTSVQNSSIQDRPTAESKKVPETLPSQSQQLLKRRGEEHAESIKVINKKIRVQSPIDERQQKISTENVLSKVDCGVQREILTLQKPQDLNSINNLKPMLQPGTRNVVEKVQQYVEQPQQDLLQPYTWEFICAEQKKDNFFKVKYFRSIASNLCKGKEEIDMPNLFQCNHCKKPIADSSFYFCFHCKDYYQLCASCNENVKHEHKMEKVGFDVNPLTRINLWVNSFFHAIECFDQKCAYLLCEDIKRAFIHNRESHKLYCNPNGCSVCTQLVAILIYHAKSCTDIKCRVPHCRTNFVRELSYNPYRSGNYQTMTRPVMQHGGMFSQYNNFYGTTSSYASTSGQQIPSCNYGMQYPNYPMYYGYGNYQQY